MSLLKCLICHPIGRVLLLILLSTFAYCQIMKHSKPRSNPLSSLSPEEYADGKLRATDAAQRVTPLLQNQLQEKQLKLGAPIFIRIFKQSLELEIWIESSVTQKFEHFKTYPIAGMSGALGPKLAEGDRQAPEGFYAVSKRLMNPRSRYHLAFNIGYPNSYDRSLGRTGSAIMVHGSTVSIGCFAMTDAKIEEIYTLCDAALKHGQPFFRVHCFPFQLTEESLSQHKEHQWLSFWEELQPGYLFFEQHRRPPNVLMQQGSYQFETDS
ncbi:L,D-transpeptidase family protein [Rubritalea tangerina]|uniref:Murein L,D-transpeptidase family protein n=1 Tax=Rubritalea tangerina TaxID=430798 RepID=A0ABW4Z7F3_9BACT